MTGQQLSITLHIHPIVSQLSSLLAGWHQGRGLGTIAPSVHARVAKNPKIKLLVPVIGLEPTTP